MGGGDSFFYTVSLCSKGKCLINISPLLFFEKTRYADKGAHFLWLTSEKERPREIHHSTMQGFYTRKEQERDISQSAEFRTNPATDSKLVAFYSAEFRTQRHQPGSLLKLV